MATTAIRTLLVAFSGDVVGAEQLLAANNAASPGQIQILTLALGDNTITVPGGGSTPTCCTIKKPSGNVTAIKLKGIAADTGIRLHNTDPDSISLDPAVASFLLNAGASIAGVILIWS